MGKKTKPRTSKKNLKWKKSAGKKTLSEQAILQNALSLCQQGNIPEAEQLFQTLRNTHSTDPTFLNQLGILAHMLGKSDLGLSYLHKSIDLHPAAPFFNNLAAGHKALGRASHPPRERRHSTTPASGIVKTPSAGLTTLDKRP